jgi:hypothetical protein
MGFDIRLPIGMMFSVFGVLAGGYGAATQGDEMYTRHSLGINVNLWWGMVMLIFGAGMLLLARRGSVAARDRTRIEQTSSRVAARGVPVAD